MDSVGQDSPFSTPRIFVLRLKPIKKRDQAVALLVEREEHLSNHEEEGGSASLSFHYKLISDDMSGWEKDGGEFSASYDDSFLGSPHVRVTSSTVLTGGYFVVDPGWLAGRGIGTFFMNEIVRWVKQWPEASVMPVELLESDAHGVNKERRNRFYENFGFVFDYEDGRRVSGQSIPMKARDLIPLSDHKNQLLQDKLERCELGEFLSGLVRDVRTLELERWGLQNQLASCDSELEAAYKFPFRWAMKTFASKFLRGY
ncbi:MAG: hypothetical protein ACXIU5_05665 [Halomonadaceae bacterium]